MITNAQLERRLNNIVNIGTVVEVNTTKALAKVDILGRISPFMPVLSSANSFKKKATPIRVNEQVAVFCPFGDCDFGFIITGFFNTNCKEPKKFDESIEVIEYSDGTIISYNTKNKVLDISCVGDINIKALGNINIEAKNINISSSTICHDGTDISKTHSHPQNSGNHFGGGTNTSSPNGC